LQRCLLLTRDAYDWLLPSTASISSTRASFALDEIASRACGLFRFPPAPPALKGVASPSDERSSTQRFHDAVVAPLDRCFGVCFSLERRGVFFPCVRHRSNRCRACRAAREMHRLTNLFAWAHTSGLRRDRPVAKPVKTSPLYDPTRLPSKGALLRLAPCGTRRARRGTWFPAVRARSALVVLPPPGLALRPFTATMPCCFVQTRLSRLGPCSRPRIVSMRALL